MSTKKIAVLSTLVIPFLISACDPTGDDPIKETNKLSGTVSAPGGAVALQQSGFWSQMVAGLLGKQVRADLTGVLPVGSDVVVELIEVDADGNQVGDVIASAKTDASGGFVLETPKELVAGPQYVIRAGDATQSVEARMSSDSLVNVDPVTSAASSLIKEATDNLGKLSVNEILEIVDAVNEAAQAVDNPETLDVAGLISAVKDAAQANETSSHVLNSVVSSGEICGTVTDSTGTALAGVRIIARDYGDWVTRARARTGSDGKYCLNVPVAGDTVYGAVHKGDYILGALNDTDTSTAASEWWTNGGGAYSQFGAEKISITVESASATRDFQLAAGQRVSGKVTAGTGGSLSEGAALEGVAVLLRNYNDWRPTFAVASKADGSYRINVLSGSYMVVARNSTRLPYATQIYTGSAGGTHNRYLSKPVTVASADVTNIDFVMQPGKVITGQVLDGPSGSPVTGIRVRFDLLSGGTAEVVRTNRLGKYRMWVNPTEDYRVRSRGQTKQVNFASVTTTDGKGTSFSANRVAINGTLTYNSSPVVQAAVLLRNETGHNLISQELSASDGSFTVYGVSGSAYKLQLKINDSQAIGSVVYDGSSTITSGYTAVTAGTDNNLAVSLPAGVVVSGTVTVNGVATGNYSIQVCDTDCVSGDVFMTSRSTGDGSYTLSLPKASFGAVQACGVDGCTTAAALDLSAAGSSHNLDFAITF